jgi:cobyrinic acid a,c-diamide synthase
VAAVVHGFMTYEKGLRIGGVILNRVGSDRHEDICRTAIEDLGVPVLGVLRRHPDIATPSRHLGLIPVAERSPEATATVARLGTLIAGSCDLDALLALAHSAPALPDTPWSPDFDSPIDPAGIASGAQAPGGSGLGAVASPGSPVVAVAGGPAFTFGYAENTELLVAAGAEVVGFDPLRDERLPEGTSGIVIGGGFPEMYASDLSANAALRAEIGAFTGTVYAECAGLLYLGRELDGAPMCEVLDIKASMTPRLTLGYRNAVAVADSVIARAGERVRGHEFHRTVVEPGHGSVAAWQWTAEAPEGFVQGSVVASYLHLHWAGSPQFAARFVASAGGKP